MNCPTKKKWHECLQNMWIFLSDINILWSIFILKFHVWHNLLLASMLWWGFCLLRSVHYLIKTKIFFFILWDQLRILTYVVNFKKVTLKEGKYMFIHCKYKFDLCRCFSSDNILCEVILPFTRIFTHQYINLVCKISQRYQLLKIRYNVEYFRNMFLFKTICKSRKVSLSFMERDFSSNLYLRTSRIW